MNFREKEVRRFSFGSLEYQIFQNFSKNIEKNTIQESCTKNGTIFLQAQQITLFLTHLVYNAVKQLQYGYRSFIYLRTLEGLIAIHDLHIYYWEHLAMDNIKRYLLRASIFATCKEKMFTILMVTRSALKTSVL